VTIWVLEPQCRVWFRINFLGAYVAPQDNIIIILEIGRAQIQGE